MKTSEQLSLMKLMKKCKLTKAVIQKAIVGSGGLISTVAQRLNVSRSTVHNYLERYPELNDLVIEERESILDFAESKLIKKINEEESWAIKFMLSTQGRLRGYGKSGEALTESVNMDKPPFSWYGEGG